MLDRGAASAAGQPAVELAAAKSLLGHAETAAGVVGVLRAAGRLQQQQRAAVLHLRSLNAYVESILDSSSSSFAVARQSAAGLTPAHGSIGAGCSAFAFQGTNAHVLLRSQALEGSADQQAAGSELSAWQRRRFWYTPAAHLLLFSAAVASSGGSTSAAFDVVLGRPALAFVWEHQVGDTSKQDSPWLDCSAATKEKAACLQVKCSAAVPLRPDLCVLSDPGTLQVQGRVLVPAAAMLEAARAAAQQLVDASNAAAGADTAALAAASIPAPLILPAGSGSSGSGAALPLARCTVSFGGAANPAVRLESRSRAAAAAVTNLAAQLCSHARFTAAHQPAPAGQALRQLLAASLPSEAPAAAACGSIQPQPEHAAPGWHCHPAPLDATLHLGVFATPHASSSAAPRVPVGAAFFVAASSRDSNSSGSATWPVMLADSASAHTTVASYTLLSSSCAAAFSLQQLESRAVGSSRQRQPAAVSAGPHLTSYSICAAAHNPAAAISAAGGSTAALSLSDSTGRLALLPHGSVAASDVAVFGPAQKALALLCSGGSAGSLRLQAVTAHDQPANPTSVPARQLAACLAAVAVQGLLKAASAEAPAASALPSFVSSSYLQPAGTTAEEPASADVFAAPLLAHGTWLLSQLLPEQHQRGTVPSGAATHKLGGSITISGGLGSLGLLTASWLAAEQQSSTIRLLGRSASSSLPQVLTASSCLVTARQCDTAAAADVAAAMCAKRDTTAYIHAGGLLFFSRTLLGCVSRLSCYAVWPS